jgi:hypothetical protein
MLSLHLVLVTLRIRFTITIGFTNEIVALNTLFSVVIHFPLPDYLVHILLPRPSKLEDRSSMDDIRHPSLFGRPFVVRRLPPVTSRHLHHPFPEGDGEGVTEEARFGEFRNNS